MVDCRFSDVIDEDYIRFRYDIADGGITCLVTYDGCGRGLFPAYGRLVRRSRDAGEREHYEVVSRFAMDCRDFLRQV